MSDKTPAAGVDLARDWSTLLQDLIPPKTVEVQDLTGAIHKLRASLPASVETRVVRKLEEISKIANVGDSLQDLAKKGKELGTNDAMAAGIDKILSMLGSDELIGVVAECFEAAHPGAVKRALANVQADETCADYLPTPPAVPTAMDLFSTADLVSGIVPFALLAGRRIGQTINSFLPESQ